jgi:putative transposon-encoded protein
MNNLTLTLDKNNDVEVGTLVKLVSGKTNGTKIETKSSMISGMNYGYSFSNNNTVENNSSIIEKPCVTELIDNNYTISATINSGFDQDSINNTLTVPETKTGNGSAELDETVLGCVSEGSNKITINATGASYSYACEKIDKVYYCSNLGNTNEAKYNNVISAITGTTQKPSTSSSATITGKYKYFLGYSQNTSFEQFDSESIRSLDIKTDWITKDSITTILDANTTIKSNGQSIVIACPKKYVLSSITNGVGADIISNFSSVGTVPVETGNVTTDYTVYVYPITNNVEVEFKNVSLNKG